MILRTMSTDTMRADCCSSGAEALTKLLASKVPHLGLWKEPDFPYGRRHCLQLHACPGAGHEGDMMQCIVVAGVQGGQAERSAVLRGVRGDPAVVHAPDQQDAQGGRGPPRAGHGRGAQASQRG